MLYCNNKISSNTEIQDRPQAIGISVVVLENQRRHFNWVFSSYYNYTTSRKPLCLIKNTIALLWAPELEETQYREYVKRKLSSISQWIAASLLMKKKSIEQEMYNTKYQSENQAVSSSLSLILVAYGQLHSTGKHVRTMQWEKNANIFDTVYCYNSLLYSHIKQLFILISYWI